MVKILKMLYVLEINRKSLIVREWRKLLAIQVFEHLKHSDNRKSKNAGKEISFE